MIKEKLEEIKVEAEKNLGMAESLDQLNEIRVAVLGKKGALTEVLKSMKSVAPEDRPKVGQLVNDVRKELEEKLENVKEELEKKALEAKLKAEVIDVTLPAKHAKVGHKHPNTVALEEVEKFLLVLVMKW